MCIDVFCNWLYQKMRSYFIDHIVARVIRQLTFKDKFKDKTVTLALNYIVLMVANV